MSRFRVGAFVSAGLVVIIMMLLSVHTLTSLYQDIGRHITLGRIIWTTHHVPSTNLFSYTARDFPFINHHWLGEVFLYLGDRLLGLRWFILLKALIISGAFALAFGARWRAKIAFPAVMIGILAALIMIERTDLRPEILSFLFLGWYLWVLYRFPRHWMIWTLPLVQLCWVNSHIYFFMGPFLFVAWWVGEAVVYGKSSLLNRRTIGIACGIALATLLNPHGIQGAFYPFHVWSNYGYSIVENKSPFFLRAYHYPFLTTGAVYAFIFVGWGTVVWNWRRARENVMGILVLFATSALALTMIRNFPLLALCGMPIMLKNIDEHEWTWESSPWLYGSIAFLVLFAVSIITNQVYDQADLAGREFGLRVPEQSQEPIDVYRALGVHGPMFNNFDIGSYLIWKLPEEPVFIDGRPEAYPADFIQHVYIPMQERDDVWRLKEQEYQLNTIVWDYYDITPWSQVFVQRILKDPEWVPVYHDHGIMIFVKNTTQNRAALRAYQSR